MNDYELKNGDTLYLLAYASEESLVVRFDGADVTIIGIRAQDGDASADFTDLGHNVLALKLAIQDQMGIPVGSQKILRNTHEYSETDVLNYSPRFYTLTLVLKNKE